MQMPATIPLHGHHHHHAPHHSHADPWAHDFICCDSDHHDSASSSTAMSSLDGKETTVPPPRTPGRQRRQPTQHEHAYPTPDNKDAEAGMAAGDVFCCVDGSCADNSGGAMCSLTDMQCCDDLKCGSDQQCDECDLHRDRSKLPVGKTTDDPSMVDLEKWACSKEGCQAIQQYLECCTQDNCNLPIIDPPAHVHVSASQIVPIPHQHFDCESWMQLPTHDHTLCGSTHDQAVAQAAMAHHTCHWQNCHQVFASMPDLLAHVASDHLGATGFPPTAPLQGVSITPDATAAPQSVVVPTNTPTGLLDTTPQIPAMSQAEQENFLNCLWDDCLPANQECHIDHSALFSTASASSQISTPVLHQHTSQPFHVHAPQPHSHNHHHMSANGEPLSPQTMLRHVLEEHLGIPSDIIGWDQNAPFSPIPLLQSQVPRPLPITTPVQAHRHANAHAHAHAHDHKTAQPHHHHIHNHLPTPSPSTNPPSPPSPVLSCQWSGCTAGPFDDSGSLMAHLSEEHVGKGKDSYVCLFGACAEGGGRMFRSRQKVLRHLQSHTGHKPFVCEVCDQAFSEAAPLAAHMRRHAKEKPFKCQHPGCGKQFAIASSLTIHMRTHNGEKPFVCSHCGKGFVEASNLTKHIRTHTGERPFACTHPGCDKRFPRPDQLKRHMSVHVEDRERKRKRKA